MQEVDPELERLREVERKAHGLFQRMSDTHAELSDPNVVAAAEELWKEAEAALRTYEARKG